MTYRTLKMFTVLLPTFLIGGFEYVRHEFLLSCLSMEAGNFLMTLLTLAISFWYATWMFRTISRIHDRLAEEQAKRAVYEERERVARELHDGIAQSLFYLNVKLKQGKIEEARTAVSAIDNQVRQAIFNLRTLPEESGSLQRRLQTWLEQWSELTNIEIETELDIPESQFSAAEEVHLFGIVQEACNNIRKHAAARHATIRFVPSDRKGFELVIADDGRGLPEQNARDQAAKYGLKMIAERAAALGAEWEIRNRPEGGTILHLHRKGGIGR
jgi:signal transduction histidine kinase